MDFALRELWQAGLLHVLFYPVHFLCYTGWVMVILGGLFQRLLLKKAKRAGTNWVFPGLLVFDLLAGEIGCDVITGWDRLFPMFGYWLCLLILLGSGVTWLVHYFFKKRVS